MNNRRRVGRKLRKKKVWEEHNISKGSVVVIGIQKS